MLLSMTEACFPAKPATCQCGVRSPRDPRIVGGEAAEVAEFPWHVGLVRWPFYVDKMQNADNILLYFRKFESRPFCGGALLSSKTVLTAAHCKEKLGIFGILGFQVK